MKRDAKLGQENFTYQTRDMIALSKHSKRLLGIRLVPYPGVDASKTVSRLPAVNASHVISLTAQVLFKSCPSTATLTRQPEIGTLHIGAVPFHYYYYSVRR